MTSPPTVLIVEDEPDLLDLFEIYFEDNYRVVTAGFGGEALEKLSVEVDVIVLDRALPDMSGEDFLEKAPNIKDVGVIVVSGFESDSKIKGLQFDKYLKKPVSREELTTAVDSLVDDVSTTSGMRDSTSVA